MRLPLEIAIEHVPSATGRTSPGGFCFFRDQHALGFHSLWFATDVSHAQCYMVEPSYSAIESVRMNVACAGRQGVFERTFVEESLGLIRKATLRSSP